MKNQRIFIGALAFALLCAALHMHAAPSDLFAAAAFPFAQIAAALRALSLSGEQGNFAAVALYALICLAPAAAALYRGRCRHAHGEDALLLLFSALLFGALYLLINPAYLTAHFGMPGAGDTAQMLVGATLYAVLACYVVLRTLRAFTLADLSARLRYLRRLLLLVGLAFVYAVSGAGVAQLVSAWRTLAAQNTDGGPLAPSYAFLTARYVIDMLPYTLGAAVTFRALSLIDALAADPYSAQVGDAAHRIARLCRAGIIAVMFSQAALNLLQLLLGSSIRQSHYTVSIPLLSIVFTLAVLLLAQYFEHSRRLKDDNDMII